jgi:hypothetical protein
MRQMLVICDEFAREFHVAFYSSKPKCVTFPPIHLKGRLDHEPVFHGGNKVIENNQQWSHLGHMLTSALDDHADIVKCLNCFISQVNKMLYQLKFLNAITSCANSDLHLVRFIIQHGVQVARMFSPFGKIFSFCANWFRFTSEDLNLLTRPMVIVDWYYDGTNGLLVPMCC